jgi:hypothetical protein
MNTITPGSQNISFFTGRKHPLFLERLDLQNISILFCASKSKFVCLSKTCVSARIRTGDRLCVRQA